MRPKLSIQRHGPRSSSRGLPQASKKWFLSGAVSLNFFFARFYSFQAAGDANPVYSTQWFLCRNDAVQTRGCCIGIVLCCLFTAVVCLCENQSNFWSIASQSSASQAWQADVQSSTTSCRRRTQNQGRDGTELFSTKSDSRRSELLNWVSTRTGISRPRGWKLLCCKEVVKFAQDNATHNVII